LTKKYDSLIDSLYVTKRAKFDVASHFLARPKLNDNGKLISNTIIV